MDFERARNAMVDSQVRTNDVTERRLQHILRTLPRELFVPEAQRPLAYAEADIPLGAPGRVLMRVRDLAKLVDTLNVLPGERTAVIAAGTGYATAVMARMAGTCLGFEPLESLAQAGRQALTAAGIEGASIHIAALDAALDGGPFDVIVLDGATEIVPDAWGEALADGGRMGVIVRDGPAGRARRYARSGAGLAFREVFDAGIPVLPGLEKPAGFTF